uniref:DNA-directed RNA polymerase III subunit n=1 Tax=Podarcis muralis TaxID=64176 RepID=A0A670J4M6_PODMU
MARSGRGRGRAALTFDIAAIGFVKGEALPEAVFGPSPLYPTTDYKPIPLKTGEDADYLLALKQELRGAMKRTPYFMTKKNESEGYSLLSSPIRSLFDQQKNKTKNLKKKGDEEKSDEEEKDKEEEEEEGEPEEYEEEEHEEENDYIASYFEDGDDYGAGSDDDMDEATY